MPEPISIGILLASSKASAAPSSASLLAIEASLRASSSSGETSTPSMAMHFET
jgi:hypothetical protein